MNRRRLTRGAFESRGGRAMRGGLHEPDWENGLAETSSEEFLSESAEDSEESMGQFSEYSDDSSDEEDLEDPASEFIEELFADPHSKSAAEKSSRDYTCTEEEEVDKAHAQYVTQICAAAAKSHTERDLQRNLLNSTIPTHLSDLQFMCGDGKCVYATKKICMGRSPKLDAVLESGVRFASKSLKVTVPDISSRTLLSIIEFLYTGDIVHHSPVDWEAGLELLRAARSFGLPFIDNVVERFLLTQVKEAVRNPWYACVMLSDAMELDFLRHDHHNNHVSLSRLVHILKRRWVDKAFVPLLLEGAVDFILRHTRQKELSTGQRRSKGISLDEYFRFRGVMLWAVRNYGDFMPKAHAEDLVDHIIPGTGEKLYRRTRRASIGDDLVWLPGYSKVNTTSNGILHLLDMHRPCKEAVLRLLSHIDWILIPHPLFLQVVEPLKLLPESQVLNIFRQHLKQLGCDSHWNHS